MYKYFIRPLLFLLQPETVHHIVVKAVKIFVKIPFFKYFLKKVYTYNHPTLEREVFGLKFSNPIGLAAGFDKNADFYNEFGLFGFSFIEIGTVTPKGQPGNPKPRSFRLVNDQALINRMGFNNYGVENAVRNIKRKGKQVIVGGNIGKNTLTPNGKAHEDYLHCFSELYDHVDYFVVNVSCPNISNLSELQDTENLKRILSNLVSFRSTKAEYKPILLKVSPDLNDNQIDDSINIAQELNIDGFVATNTSTSRERLKTPISELISIGNGGLSGKPIRDRSTDVIKHIANKTQGKMPIIGVGGIMNEQDAIDKLNAGATLIQLYTGFIYSGPSLVKKISRSLAKKS